MKVGDLVKIHPTYTESNKNGDRFLVLKSDVGIVLKRVRIKISASSYWEVLRSDGTIYDYSFDSLRVINEV